MAQWVKNLTAVVGSLWRHGFDPQPSAVAAAGFDPWPWNFHMPLVQPHVGAPVAVQRIKNSK